MFTKRTIFKLCLNVTTGPYLMDEPFYVISEILQIKLEIYSQLDCTTILINIDIGCCNSILLKREKNSNAITGFMICKTVDFRSYITM